jgi:hypothetical protein
MKISDFQKLVIKFMIIALRYMWADVAANKNSRIVSPGLSEYLDKLENDTIELFGEMRKL